MPWARTQPNRWRDVYKVQKSLANTGHYALDLTQEKSGEHTPTLAQAIRNFQREKREEIDGLLLPGGPTIKRLSESLFGENVLAIRPLPGAAPLPGSAESADAQNDRLQLASQLPKTKPPKPSGVPGGADRLPPWLRDQIRRLPDNPSPRGPKQFPQDREQVPDDKPAVIVTMPNNDAYILLNPAPRDRRSPGSSDFVRSDGAKDAPHKAYHFDYSDGLPRQAFGHALPMYPKEAEDVRHRTPRAASGMCISAGWPRSRCIARLTSGARAKWTGGRRS